MHAQISALSTALPAYCLPQKAIAQAMQQKLILEPKKAKKLQKIYEQTAIDTRYVSIEGFLEPIGDHFFSKQMRPKMRERNELYKEKALPLAAKAAKKTLLEWGRNPKEITHVISVSCTGIFAPGLEFSLIETLGLSSTVERLGINFMGCFGAFRALATAASIAKEDSSHRILIVCTELCSLHFQPTDDWDSLIASALFSDGAAAAIVEIDSSKASFEIVRKKALSLPNTFEEMQWQASDEGLLMKLSPYVPRYLKQELKAFVKGLLQNETEIAHCDWPIHPGGKAILEYIEEELGLTKEQTRPAWEILAQYGNMSSVTFLFVLKNLLETPKNKRKAWAVGLGFGPGLSLEGILLKQI